MTISLAGIHEGESTVDTMGKYGLDYRSLFFKPPGVAVLAAITDPQQRLLDGDATAKFLEPLVGDFLVSFNLISAPPSERTHLEKIAERLVFYGLRTHCLLYRTEYRGHYDVSTDRDELGRRWLIESLSASTKLRGYSKENQEVPKLIFNAVFDAAVEPIQHKLGLGWWKRIKNHAKFLNLFDSGILLVMLYDMKSKEQADRVSVNDNAEHTVR